MRPPSSRGRPYPRQPRPLLSYLSSRSLAARPAGARIYCCLCQLGGNSVPRIRLVQTPVDRIEADLLAVPVYKDAVPGAGAEVVATKLGVKLKDLLEQNRFRGDFGDALTVPTLGKLAAKQVLFVGLGDKNEVKAREIRRAGALVARRAGAAKRIATTIPHG